MLPNAYELNFLDACARWQHIINSHGQGKPKGRNHVSRGEFFFLLRSVREYEAEACEWKASQVCLFSFLHRPSLQMQLLLCSPFFSSWNSLLVTTTSQKEASEIRRARVNDLCVNAFKTCSCNIRECCKGQSCMLISRCIL